MTERNIIKSLTQKDIHKPGFHPNNANPLSTAPTTSAQHFSSNLRSLGMSDASELPKEFDWREEPGVILTPPMNQGHCGNCWAVSSTQSFADRWMIATNKTGLVLDPLATTVCVPGNRCGGNLPEKCQAFFETVGASHSNNNCPSWVSYCNQVKDCCDGCSETNSKGSPSITCEELKCSGGFKAKKGLMKSGTVTGENGQINASDTIHSIKTDIMLHGPAVAKYQVFGDFMVADAGLVVAGGKTFNWKSTNGVYLNGHYGNELAHSFQRISKNTPSGDPTKLEILARGLMPSLDKAGKIVGVAPSQKSMGFHAVEMIGWGVDETWGEYWIIKNSWGDKWNGDGYFKFGMNTDGKRNNTCGMDIPIKVDGSQLFGGTVSFVPTANPNMKWSSEQDANSSDGDVTKKWWPWVIVGIVALLIIYFLFFSEVSGGESRQSRQSSGPRQLTHGTTHSNLLPSIYSPGKY